jgi:large subunit ribosomal protein L21
MYAIVKTGGKQYRVERGQRLLIERLAAEQGQEVSLEPLLYRSEDAVVDKAGLEQVKVTAKVIEHVRGEKLRVFKFKPKRGYRRRTGHRQELTRIEVTEIAHGAAHAKAPAKARAQAPGKAPAGAPGKAPAQPATKPRAKAPAAATGTGAAEAAKAKPKAAAKPARASAGDAAGKAKAAKPARAAEREDAGAGKAKAKPARAAKPKEGDDGA